MALKILHIISGLNDGGAESLLFNFVCNEANHENFVISLKGKGKYGKMIEEKGIKIYYFNFSFNLSLISNFISLIKIIKFINPDIVQTWLYHANLIGGCASYIANSKNIFWGIHHGSLKKNSNKFSTIFIAKINSLLSYFIPKKIIVCADSSKFIHIQQGFSRKKIITITNGLDLNKFKRSSQERSFYRNKINIKSDDTLYGTVARFHPIKDHKTLLKSIFKLKNSGYKFKYLLIGKNINNKNKLLNQLIKKYRLEEIIILIEHEENISLVMNALDLHVLSSKSEAFPMVILEAMGCGTPCISTNVGDVKKLIFDNNFIVPTSNQKKLFSAMRIFSDTDKKYKKKLSISGEKLIKENYSIEKMIMKYLNLYYKYIPLNKK